MFSVFGASNEFPEEDESLEALYDRFLFRYKLSYIQDDENFRSLLFRDHGDFKPSVNIQVSAIYELRESAKNLPVDPDVELIILELRKNLQLQQIEISDRRWKKVIQVLKVAACSNGCMAVDRTMALLLQHMLWNLPEERENIRKMVFELVVSGGISTEKLRQEAEDLHAAASLALKNELTIKVICDSCWEEFLLRQEIETHHLSHKNHSYTLKKDGVSKIYPYDNLVREIDSINETVGKKSTLTSAQKEVFEKEIESLVNRIRCVKYRLEEERDLLRSLIEKNIWLSTLDRKEALMLHDSRSIELVALDTIVSKAQSMLGLESSKVKPKPQFTEEKAKIIVTDSFSSVNSFMKEIGSRLRLK